MTDTTRVEPTTGGPDWHQLSAEDVASRFGTDLQGGLSTPRAAELLRVYGPNALTRERSASVWTVALSQFRDPMTLMLAGVAVVSVLIAQGSTAAVVIALILLNVVLGTNQEMKARASVEALSSLQVPQARVVRDGEIRQIPTGGNRPARSAPAAASRRRVPPPGGVWPRLSGIRTVRRMELVRQVVVFDAADLHAESAFWAGMLDGHVFADDAFHTVIDAAGDWRIGVQLVPHHVAPDWPDGAPQQVHLDLHAEDPRAAHEQATRLGARLLRGGDLSADEGHQVYADPAGHPFCIGWGQPSADELREYVRRRLG